MIASGLPIRTTELKTYSTPTRMQEPETVSIESAAPHDTEVTVTRSVGLPSSSYAKREGGHVSRVAHRPAADGSARGRP